MQLHAAVAKQPVAVAIGTKYSDLQHYSGGIFDGYCPTRPDHAVMVTGYHGGYRDPAHWIIKNSWGGHWGNDGFLRIPRNHEYGDGKCGIQKFPSYPLKTSDNPISKSQTGGVTFCCMPT